MAAPIPCLNDPLARACEACRRLYGRRPDVLGVGTGLKLTGGLLRPDTPCVQFYVRRKLRRPAARARLPRFVYARRRDGRVDRSRRLATDVVELRGLRFAARSGAPLEVTGERGALTLLFRNKAPGASGTYLLTCAHVAGEVTGTPPADPRIVLPDAACGPVRATTLMNATAARGGLEYDIALAEVAGAAEPLPDCEVAGQAGALVAFLPSEELRPGRLLACAFPVSNVPVAHICSGRVDLPLLLDGREYRVGNLFLIDRAPRRGDSGGLLYDGDRAAGLLVGLSESGFGLFQPLGEAFAHLQALCPFPLACFPSAQALPSTFSQTPTKGRTCTPASSLSDSPRSSAAASPAARRSSPAKRTSRKRRKACASIRPRST